ncbi:MAG: TolC family protein [Planctomycetales bacterium]|nr:TolC family protein [Planctomycetales bacterium]
MFPANQVRASELTELEAPVIEPAPQARRMKAPNGMAMAEAWWERPISSPLNLAEQPVPITVESVVLAALQNSAQVRVYRDIPLIRETTIMEADATFDWTSFIDTRWRDISEPVGSILTTNRSRFKDHDITASGGIRRQNTFGGEVEIAQQFRHQDTNSQFFIPSNQGSSRLTLSYTQPLLRGAGRTYNTSITVLAQLDASIGWDEYSLRLQDHLVDVVSAYWDLYVARGSLLQKRRLLEGAQKIRRMLDDRKDYDATHPQITRAEALVRRVELEVIRAENQVWNLEDELRKRVNDPSLGVPGDTTSPELVTNEGPARYALPVNMMESISTAMQHRPEMSQSIKRVKKAGVSLNVAKNELLPILNAVLQTYASGLRGESDIPGAWTDQFSVREPSYSIGLQYEQPIGNRQAKARYQRRCIELRQSQSDLETTIALLQADVARAVREVDVAFRGVHAGHKAMSSARDQVNSLFQQWQTGGGDGNVKSLLLDNLLDAQERLTFAEFEYLSAQARYSLALIEYKRALGLLLENQTTSDFAGDLTEVIHSPSPQIDYRPTPLDVTPVPTDVSPPSPQIQQLPPPPTPVDVSGNYSETSRGSAFQRNHSWKRK